MFGFVRLHDARPLTGAQVKWLAFQLAHALVYLHDQVKIAHRGEWFLGSPVGTRADYFAGSQTSR